MLSTKRRLSMSCSGTTDTWVDKALNVLHHQLTGQTNGMLEVSRGNVPVRMVFMATAKPKRHHRKEKVNNCIDAKPWSWKSKASVRTVTLAPLLQLKGSSLPSHGPAISFEGALHCLRRIREFTTDWGIYGLWWHFSCFCMILITQEIHKYTHYKFK